AWRARPMLADCQRNSDHLTRLDVAQFRPGAPVDRAGRKVEQQINNARRLAVEQPNIKLLELRPHAGKASERGKQGVEDSRSHGNIIAKFSDSCPASCRASTCSWPEKTRWPAHVRPKRGLRWPERSSRVPKCGPSAVQSRPSRS